MSSFISLVAGLILATGFFSAHEPEFKSSEPAFESAVVVSATDIQYPPKSIAIGTVVLEVTVSRTGDVEDVRPVREIQSLTEVATEAVKNWRFKPALLDGRPVRSRTAVAVTFNPAALPAADVPLSPLSPEEHSGSIALQPKPVEVVTASFPQYPPNSVTEGTVVLRVVVDENGRTEKIVPVREIASLTSQAVRGVQKWKFRAAEFEGKPVPSSIAVALVLRPPSSSN